MDDPLPPGRLRQTLKDLQKKFKDAPITFRARRDRQGDPVDNRVRLAHAPISQLVPPPRPASLAWATRATTCRGQRVPRSLPRKGLASGRSRSSTARTPARIF